MFVLQGFGNPKLQIRINSHLFYCIYTKLKIDIKLINSFVRSDTLISRKTETVLSDREIQHVKHHAKRTSEKNNDRCVQRSGSRNKANGKQRRDVKTGDSCIPHTVEHLPHHISPRKTARS